jgi:hypothetical protein
MTDGGVREFNVPEDRKFIIDGRELTVHDLKPGTKLSATVTTTATSHRANYYSWDRHRLRVTGNTVIPTASER